MQEKETIESVFEKLKKERDYQDHLCLSKEMPLKPSIEGEIVMLKTYTDKVLTKWVKEQDNPRNVLSEIRKIAGIAIRCLENHGCPKRDMLKGFMNNE